MEHSFPPGYAISKLLGLPSLTFALLEMPWPGKEWSDAHQDDGEK